MPQSSFRYELFNTGKKIQKTLSHKRNPKVTSSKKGFVRRTHFFCEITALEIWVGYTCDNHGFPKNCFETAADFVYISESNENWEKYSSQR